MLNTGSQPPTTLHRPTASATRRDNVFLIMGVDVKGMRKVSPDAGDLCLLDASDLREAYRQADGVSDENLQLLRIDLRRSDRRGWMFMNPVGSYLAGLIADAQTLGIASGSLICADDSIDLGALFDETRAVLRSRGHNVIDHVPGWEVVGRNPAYRDVTRGGNCGDNA